MKKTIKKLITSSVTILTLLGSLSAPLASLAAISVSQTGSANIILSGGTTTSGDTTYTVSDSKFLAKLQAQNPQAFASYLTYVKS